MKKNKKYKIILFIILFPAMIFVFLISIGATNFRVKKKKEKISKKVSCVGDSITYGMGVRNWLVNNYPAKLGQLLGDDYEVGNFGVSGTTALSISDRPYIEEAVYKESILFNPEIVIIMFGTNDSKIQNWRKERFFKDEYTRLINSYKKLESVSRIILATPAYAFEVEGECHYNIQKDIVLKIRDIVIEIGNMYNYEVVDIYSVTKEKKEYYAIDGIHPNKKGAKAISEAVFEVLSKK